MFVLISKTIVPVLRLCIFPVSTHRLQPTVHSPIIRFHGNELISKAAIELGLRQLFHVGGALCAATVAAHSAPPTNIMGPRPFYGPKKL